MAVRGLGEWCDNVVVTTNIKSIIEQALCRTNSFFDHPSVYAIERPAHLATHDAPMRAVVLHALDWYRHLTGKDGDKVVVLQPTSPMRSEEDILLTLDALKAHEAAITVCCQSLHLLENERPITKEVEIITGSVYAASVSSFREKESFFLGPETAKVGIPRIRSLDIDTWSDLQLAIAIWPLLGKR